MKKLDIRDEIEKVLIIPWDNGQKGVVIAFRDGTTVALPAEELPESEVLREEDWPGLEEVFLREDIPAARAAFVRYEERGRTEAAELELRETFARLRRRRRQH